MGKKSEARVRLQDSISQFEAVASIKGIGEFIDAFEELMPLPELAETMVDIIRDTEGATRERIFCINFFLSAKKFQEKNRPEVKDEDLEKMSTGQIMGLLKHGYKELAVCQTDEEYERKQDIIRRKQSGRRRKPEAAGQPESAHPEGDGMGEESGSGSPEE